MKKVLLILSASAMLAAPAFAGINPALPGLPSVTDAVFAAAVPNNQISSMCVDCHGRQPKAGGTHFVNTAGDGGTNSGGSGNGGTLGAIAARNDGEYFKVTAWNVNTAGSAGVSKYGDTASLSRATSVAAGSGARTATVNATVANYSGYDIICESCHNIVVNEAGGNNLLLTQPSNEWSNAATAEICVGCHGWMYTTNTENSANTNYASAINDNEVVTGAKKGNNEYHWIRGTRYAQNHHVMTGDNMNGTLAGQGLLWTDNTIVAYAAGAITNTATRGTAPQKAPWTFAPTAQTKPTTAANLNCTNCHTPAHGFGGGSGGSILRNAVYTHGGQTGPTTRTNPWSRISDMSGWKKIDDRAFCGQCHN